MLSKTSFIVRSASVMMIGTFISRIFGLFRDMAVAAFFGATAEYDAFLVAYTVPNLLRRLLAEGALSAAFIPVFTARIAKGEMKEAWYAVNSLLNIMLLMFAIIVGMGEILSPWIVKVIAPGFATSTYQLSVSLTRIMFPFIVFMSFAAICMGMLNAMNRFFVPSFAPAMLNIVIISGMLLVGRKDFGIFSLAVVVLLGGASQFLIQLPVLFKKGYRYRFVIDFHNEDVVRIFKLMLPYIFGLAVTQLDIVIDRLLASFLSAGSISVLNYALRIVLLPMGVFGVAISTAVFPTLSKHSVLNELDAFKDSLIDGLAFVSFIIIPAAVGLIVLGEPIITLLFKRGEFGFWAVHKTAFALGFYAVGLPFMAHLNLILKAFYATHDTKTPVRVGAFMVALNFLLAFVFMRFLGVGGLALATSVVSTVNFCILFHIFRKRVDGLLWKDFFVPFARMAFAAFMMSFVIFPLEFYWLRGGCGWNLLVKLAIVIVLGVATFVGTVYVFKFPEKKYTSIVRDMFLKKLGGKGER